MRVDNFYDFYLFLISSFISSLLGDRKCIKAKTTYCFDDIGKMQLLCIKISVWLEKERIYSIIFYWEPFHKQKNFEKE